VAAAPALIVLAVVMGGLASLSLAFGGSETSTAVFIDVVAVYSVAAHASNAELPVALALIAAGVAVHDLRDPDIAAFGDAVWNTILLGLTFLVGLGMRRREARARALEEETRALFGGQLEAGPRPDGGWTLRAILPVAR
jgi:hypothetical protein